MLGRPVLSNLTDEHLLERFLQRREEASFTLLVVRHGPMVRSVCRRLLQDEHEAEDAFQATFLVLTRSAAAIRQRQSLASWLYGVAYRIACKTRTRAARRQGREQSLGARECVAPAGLDEAMRELQVALQEELASLPDRYRAPLVLCYLEGKTKD